MYRMLKVLFFAVIVCSGSAFAGDLTGTITDADGNALPGANITVLIPGPTRPAVFPTSTAATPSSACPTVNIESA